MTQIIAIIRQMWKVIDKIPIILSMCKNSVKCVNVYIIQLVYLQYEVHILLLLINREHYNNICIHFIFAEIHSSNIMGINIDFRNAKNLIRVILNFCKT